MKRSFLLIALVLTFVSFGANAQKFEDLDASPLDVVFFPTNVPKSDFRGEYAPAKMKVYYSRPQLKGVDKLTKHMNGSIWRMGANEANEITFYQDVTVGETKIDAGTYSLFAEVTEDTWTFILHSKLNTWGRYTLGKGSSEIARINGIVSKSDEKIEALSMMFKEVEGGAHLVVGWQNTIAEMPIKF